LRLWLFSMKHKVNRLIAIIVVAACLVLALFVALFLKQSGYGWLRRDERSGRQTREQSQPEVPFSVDDRGSWPMFRGGQQLLGRCSPPIGERWGKPHPTTTTLAESLVPVWKFQTDGEVKSSPIIDSGRVYVGSADANVYAIDLASGDELWSYRTDDRVEATPCVVEGSVFVGSGDTYLYALDAENGRLGWKYETGGEILGAANWVKSPDGEQTWILVGSYDSKLHCVDAANGKAVWTYETESFVNGAPAVAEGLAVFGGCDARIHVVSLSDGSMHKQIDTGSYIAGSAAFLRGQVYVGNYDSVLLKADISSGEIVWKYSSKDGAFFSSPAVGEDVVVLGGRDERVHCVRRDNGKPVWTFQTLGQVDSSPVICGDKVLVGSEDGRVYMLRLSDGSKVWSYEIGEAVTSSAAVASGMVVIGSDDGYVYAFASKQ
jgi:outer membrane protein assembly factor BamB